MTLTGYTTDSILRVGVSQKHAAILLKFATLQGEVLKGRKPIKGDGQEGCEPDAFVNERHLMHGLVRGIYVPRGDKFALSIQLTEREKNYGKEITYFSPSEWRIEYRPPTDKRPSDGRAISDTQALKNCMERQVPVGILRSIEKGVNEVLGLGTILGIENGSFTIVPLLMDDDTAFEKIEQAADRYVDKKISEGDYSAPDKQATILARRGQERFRRMLLEIYGGCCAFCGLDIEGFLIASHIVEWKRDRNNRLNPQNGLLLCRLCDRAFELGEITLETDLQIRQSAMLVGRKTNPAVNSWLSNLGKRISVKVDGKSPHASFIETKNSHLKERSSGALVRSNPDGSFMAPT